MVLCDVSADNVTQITYGAAPLEWLYFNDSDNGFQSWRVTFVPRDDGVLAISASDYHDIGLLLYCESDNWTQWNFALTPDMPLLTPAPTKTNLMWRGWLATSMTVFGPLQLR